MQSSEWIYDLPRFLGEQSEKVFSGIKRTAFFSFAFDSDDIQLPDLWSLFKRLDLKIDEMISLPYKTMEHGVFVLSKADDERRAQER